MEEKKLQNALSFYLLVTRLKERIRSGWDENHWEVRKDRLESVAEHSFGTCMLAISLDSEFKLDVDMDKVIKMLVIHELGETIIGDITPFDDVSPEEKMRMEHEAVLEVVGNLVKKDELLSLLLEFDDQKSKEAIFANYCDKMEALIQSKVYQDYGYHANLDELQDNAIIKDKRVKKAISNGAKTVFDIWYMLSKDAMSKDELFAGMLEYLRNTNTSTR